MFRYVPRLSGRAGAAALAAALTVSAAGAATIHRFAIAQGTGSGGANATVQTNASGGALQGEVAATPNTTIKLPFGVLGEFDAAGSTFGLGVVGISTTGYALAGESLSNTQPSILAFPGGNGPGLEAVSSATSGYPAIIAAAKGSGDGISVTSSYGYPIYAQSGNGMPAMYGVNPGNGYGIYGEVDGSAGAGVIGSADDSIGVFGYTGASSNSSESGVAAENDGPGNGVSGSADQGYGVYGTSASGDGLHGEVSNANSGAAAINHSTGTGLYVRSDGGPGASINSGGGDAIEATANNGFGVQITTNDTKYDALNIAQDDAGAYAISVATPSGFAFLLDSSGNEILEGHLTTASGTYARTRNPSSDLVSYSAQESQPVMEDVGSAHLVNGSAAVAIAPDFRQTIDGTTRYMVFLTPYGDNRGLFVASRTPNGFVVREAQGGRSTLDFDYRIVAQAYGETKGRLPHYAAIEPAGVDQHLADVRAAARRTLARMRPANPNWKPSRPKFAMPHHARIAAPQIQPLLTKSAAR